MKYNQHIITQKHFVKVILFLIAITLQFKVSVAQQTDSLKAPSVVNRPPSTVSNLRTKTLYLNKNQQADTIKLDTLTIVPNSIKIQP
ncbi:MAG: hypothetical protein ACPGVB_17690, partial [Chitinophagales bacterium]